MICWFLQCDSNKPGLFKELSDYVWRQNHLYMFQMSTLKHMTTAPRIKNKGLRNKFKILNIQTSTRSQILLEVGTNVEKLQKFLVELNHTGLFSNINHWCLNQTCISWKLKNKKNIVHMKKNSYLPVIWVSFMVELYFIFLLKRRPMGASGSKCVPFNCNFHGSSPGWWT